MPCLVPPQGKDQQQPVLGEPQMPQPQDQQQADGSAAAAVAAALAAAAAVPPELDSASSGGDSSWKTPVPAATPASTGAAATTDAVRKRPLSDAAHFAAAATATAGAGSGELQPVPVTTVASPSAGTCADVAADAGSGPCKRVCFGANMAMPSQAPSSDMQAAVRGAGQQAVGAVISSAGSAMEPFVQASQQDSGAAGANAQQTPAWQQQQCESHNSVKSHLPGASHSMGAQTGGTDTSTHALQASPAAAAAPGSSQHGPGGQFWPHQQQQQHTPYTCPRRRTRGCRGWRCCWCLHIPRPASLLQI